MQGGKLTIYYDVFDLHDGHQSAGYIERAGLG